MFSVVCFLRHILKYTGTTTSITGVLATDNTGLIARVESQTKTKYPVLNSVFKSDWDIVKAIVRTIQAAPIHATFEHVKGNQDEDIHVDKLDLLAQLNVEADQHAGEYRSSHTVNIVRSFLSSLLSAHSSPAYPPSGS
jgi:hypothetical protein